MDFIDDDLRHPADQPTIGIVLCRSRKQSIINYALRGMSQPIGVFTYELGNVLPEAVQQSLPSVEQLQMEIESAVAELEEDNKEKRDL